ncbi:MAG: protein-L-isoaspartate(D-aspartate) O-methyltransferase [Rhodospirillaceae bacterium]|nr:protein-L-isoaspartate(D-aspartate) O-methyltransferase [Rhodospirillaceae bacterium]
MSELQHRRAQMVEHQIAGRGVRDPLVLAAMRKVPREKFLPERLHSQAYDDTPLPIAEGQTISQPYIVAFMVEALVLRGGEKVLEIGAGSGYAAAVLAEIAGEVYTIERIGQLAEKAASNLSDAGYRNVHVLHEDGTRGWLEYAPFDGILVSAGAPDVPESLKNQLAEGGRLVIPVGHDERAQELIRITRKPKGQFEREDLADVRFVPLIGAEGWEVPEPAPATSRPRVIRARAKTDEPLPSLIVKQGESFAHPDDADLGPLLDRIGDARVVLIGESSHGTSEFYRMRARITRELIAEKDFGIVAAEADWPDAARIDHYVRHRDTPASDWIAFTRFPTWMWRNVETRDFIDWLHERNKSLPYEQRAGFYGLDLYSLYDSVRAVVDYLDDVDPDLAQIARLRYGCLSPWEADPAAYGHAALTGHYHNCEGDVVRMLTELHGRRQDYALKDGERFLDAEQNARVVANAERYYRVMYYGSRASWNLRDRHMFETLQSIMTARGPAAKAVVWAHNSHIGDASATEMAARGEINIGQLCREAFGKEAYAIGFGTDHGTVAAASDWGGEMEIKQVRPAHPQSHEWCFHRTNVPGLMLPLRQHPDSELARRLQAPRLERAIGVIYRPETELASHYFEAILPNQFDEYIWIDETCAIEPLDTGELRGMPETYPFGL